MLIFLLILSIALIIFGTTRLKIHPFLVLFFTAILFGLCAGMASEKILESINDGFGKTIGSIGLIIILGVIIGAFLENTGGAFRLAHSVLKLIGAGRVSWAMAFMGFIISIPVFCDSGFVMMNSLNKVLTRQAKLSIVITATALAMGLLASHTMIPPTPGPLAAAGLLDAEIGLVIFWGFIISLTGLLPTVLFVQWIGKKIYIEAVVSGEDNKETGTPGNAPGTLRSVLPIVVPLVLIILKSFDNYRPFIGNAYLKEIINFAGNPVIALTTGFLFALALPSKLEKFMLSGEGWIGKALRDSAEIIMITGAGGIFGKILQNAGLGELIGTRLAGLPLGLALPFLISAALKTAQGSSTIAMITTASIMASLMGSLGFESETSRALVVVAIGAGSVVVSHVNDSFFWVVTQMSGIHLSAGYRSMSAASGILGISSLIVCILLHYLFGG